MKTKYAILAFVLMSLTAYIVSCKNNYQDKVATNSTATDQAPVGHPTSGLQLKPEVVKKYISSTNSGDMVEMRTVFHDGHKWVVTSVFNGVDTQHHPDCKCKTSNSNLQ